MIKRIVVALAMLLCMLSGCSSDVEDKEKIETNDEKTVETEARNVEDGKPMDSFGIYASVNLHKLSVDEGSREVTYDKYLEDTITYDGTSIEMGISISVDTVNRQDATIDGVLLMVVGDDLIPFSVDGGQEQSIHNVTLKNGGTDKKVIKFTPDMIEKGQATDWRFVVVPFIEGKTHTVEKARVIECSKGIVSTVDKVRDVSVVYSDEGDYIDSTEKVYGKGILEICMFEGGVKDYVLQDSEGKWTYLGSPRVGKRVVILICDGKLYEGFEGSYGMLVEEGTEKYIVRNIDTSKLTKGNHKMCAVTLVYNEDGMIGVSQKSLMANIEIGE